MREREAAEMHRLGLHGCLETVDEAFCYHTGRAGAALEIWRVRETRAALEGFPVTILFGFANRFSLSSHDDDRPVDVSVPSHLQKTVVAIVLSGQFDVKKISVRKCSNGLGDNDYVLCKAGHSISLLRERLALHHIGPVL
jgi:hypothetical protein